MSVSLRLMDRSGESSRLPRIHRGLLDDSASVSSLELIVRPPGALHQRNLKSAPCYLPGQSNHATTLCKPGSSPTVRIGKPRTICTNSSMCILSDAPTNRILHSSDPWIRSPLQPFDDKSPSTDFFILDDLIDNRSEGSVPNADHNRRIRLGKVVCGIPQISQNENEAALIRYSDEFGRIPVLRRAREPTQRNTERTIRFLVVYIKFTVAGSRPMLRLTRKST